MAERSSKSRLSSTVVIPRSNRRERRERNRSPDVESSKNRTNNRDYQQHDDRVNSRSERTTNDSISNENRPRRNWQNDQLAVKERLGLVRDRERQRQPRMIEINTDPRDVPRGNRYFEHDDRESAYGNQKFKNINRRRSFPRQRSRSPVWKHDHFEDEQRRNRSQRPRQPWRQREGSPAWKHDRFRELENDDKQQRPRQSSWRQRERSPLTWKHDKFKELENEDKEAQEAKDETDKHQKRRRKSS